MIVITFGDPPKDVHILYDRDNKLCVVVVNDMLPFPDALATIRSFKADRIFVIAPEKVDVIYGSLKKPGDMKLYEFTK